MKALALRPTCAVHFGVSVQFCSHSILDVLKPTMVQHTLSLGIPGDLIFPGSTIDERASHIGGNPTCPAGVDSPDHELLKCKICGEILDAVLSVSS